MRRNKGLYLVWAIGVLLATGTGCVKDRFSLDEDALEAGGESIWGIPIGGGTITLGSAQPWLEDVGISSDPISGNWYWVKDFELFDYSAAEIWELPVASFSVNQYLDANAAAVLNALPAGVTYQIPANESIALQLPSGMTLQEVFFEEGSLNLQVDYTLDLPLEISIAFPFLSQAGETWVASRIFEGAGEYDWTVPLDGVLLQMPVAAASEIPFQLTASFTANGNPVEEGQGIAISGAWDWSGWDWIVGTAGDVSEWTFEAQSDIPVFAWAQDGALHIADPQVHLRVENETGIPFAWGLESMTLQHAGGSTAVGGWQLQSPPMIAPAPALGLMAITQHLIDNSGTVPPLSDLIDLHPTSALLSGVLGIDTNTPNSQFISRNARVRASGEIRFPLWGYASGFGWVDTLEVGVSKALSDALIEPLDWTDLASVTLRLETSNSLPLDLGLQVLFLDSIGAPVDSLFAEDWMVLQGGMLDAALVPGDPGFGEVIAPAFHRTDFTIERDRARAWLELGIEKVMVKAIVSTQGADQSWDIRLHPEDALSLYFAAKIHVDWNP